MPSSQQVPDGQQQPSAFNALGSYADRIKDANGNPTKIAQVNDPKSAASSSLTSNGNTPKSNNRSPSATPSSSSSTSKPRHNKSISASQSQSQKESQEEDGSWETVRSNRQRAKQQEEKEKEKHGSNSKNWRDRSGQKQKSSGDDSEKKSGHGKSSKKQTLNNASSTAATSETTPKPASTISAPSKPAWGALAQTAKPATSVALTNDLSKDSRRDSGQQQQSQTVTVPSSPSLNGTTITANSISVPPSIGSPNLSSETASTSTAPASVLSKAVDKLEGEEEGSWRAKQPQQLEEAPQAQVQPAQPRQAAPPPAVNAWDIRKKSILLSTPITTSQAKPATSLSSRETTQKAIPNGNAKVEAAAKPKKKTAAKATSSALPPPINDINLWPDVKQAAKAEDKKEKVKSQATNEEASAAEESTNSTTTGKKQKWTAIPAAELLAAVDQAKEDTRRQHKAEAHARKRASVSKAEANEASGSTANKAGKPRKNSSQVAEGKKNHGAEGAVNKEASAMEGSTQEQVEKVEKSNGDVNNGSEFSRQLSNTSKPGSPKKGDHQALTSPVDNETSPQVRIGNEPSAPQSKPMVASNTAPLPQQGFNNHALPRVPRGRDPRQSYNGGGNRGRGGFRSNSAFVHKPHSHFGSPPLGGSSNLPNDGLSNGFPRGHGQFGGFQTFYPVQGFGQPNPSVYDPMQAQYGAGAVYRAGLPPPPMPQTVVPNLDATRFYVLGQIEYYFSMQNLAMDFFLRQQMDSEGWIDIAMIASFNRVKSLTPDISIVKECMVMSSLLEVREESVRLAGQDTSRWVLPDAKASKFPSDQSPTSMSGSPSQHTEESRDLSLNANDTSMTSEEGSVLPPIGQRIGGIAAEVENALMKNSSAAPVSTVDVVEEKKQDDANVIKETSDSTESMVKNEEEEVKA
uniref:HTH La-type RNA-binding domain-containing protein n=1 Tax=Kwoniella pini CBS 10737 TaxID=1296096 RepID=A0A1B9HVK5_9TREE|nr:uncharacterized protein I206_07084 [Kwoniella pini CBS 10737]OCF47305.1 hypothetical protein I206_07084 [Kwoniella pini CBS 10737]